MSIMRGGIWSFVLWQVGNRHGLISTSLPFVYIYNLYAVKIFIPSLLQFLRFIFTLEDLKFTYLFLLHFSMDLIWSRNLKWGWCKGLAIILFNLLSREMFIWSSMSRWIIPHRHSINEGAASELLFDKCLLVDKA